MANIMVLDVAFAHVGMVILGYADGGWSVRLSETITTKKSDAKTGVRAADDNVRRTQETFNRLHDLAETYDICGIIAEIPTGGSKSSAAARAMGMGTATAACLAASLDVVCEWTTPGDGKLALTGIKNASKIQMKATAAKMWPKTTTGFHLKKKTKKSTNKEPEWDDNYEHVADAMGAFSAARNGTVEKLAVQLSKMEKKK